MSSLQMWKEKVQSIFQSINRKEVITVAGLSAFMGASYLLFRYLQKCRSPATQHIHSIYLNVLKSLQTSGKHRQPLIIEEQHTVQHKNITMIYTLVSKLKEKQKNNEQSIRNPFLPPFEDGLFIQQLGSSHRLLFNKYNIYDQHLLLVTKEFQPQSLPLSKQDLKQCVYAFKAIRGLFFYNSGSDAGASQIHKHLQIFPSQAKDLPIFRSILEYVRELKHQQAQSKHLNPQEFSIIEYPSFNFRHGLIVIGSNENHSQSDHDKSKESTSSVRSDSKMTGLIENTYKAYERLYASLIQSYEGEETPDYNLFGCEHFMMLIPRRKEKAFDELSINAVGFMGSILFKDKNLLRKYISEDRQGLQILEDITFPNSKKR